MVELAKQQAVPDTGRPAVLLVPDMVHIAGRAGRLSQPSGHAQCLSRAMTARRIGSGMLSE
jgi:hypothetical protein